MSNSYRYSSLLKSAEYTLTSEGVDAIWRRYGRVTKTFVSFEHIPIRSSTVTWASKPLLWAAIIFAVLFVVIIIDLFVDPNPEPAALVLYGMLCAICLIAYVITRTTSELFMTDGNHLSVFRRRAADSRLTSFIEALQRKKLDFYKERISRRAKEVPADENRRYLLYLRESALIDDEGYDQLRSHLDGLILNERTVGFN